MSNQINDEWFYDSIHSYDTLFQYELRLKPLHLARLEKYRLCISGQNDTKNMSELIVVSMPEKLFLSENNANLCKNNDFEIDSSQFLKSKIHMIQNIARSEKAVVSFEDSVGLTIFDFLTEGKPSLSHTLRTPNFISPNLTTHSRDEEIIVTKDVSDQVFKIDASTGQETNCNMVEEFSKFPGEVFCYYCDNSSVVLLHSTKGNVATLDTRSFDYSIIYSEFIDKSNYVLSNDNNNQIALLSSEGSIKIFDRRRSNEILIKTNLEHKLLDDHRYIKINLTSENRCSVSGFDNYVYIYDTSGNDFQQIFKHRGHDESEEEFENSIVTDHFWLSEVSTNMVVSCANNGTLNCWEYVV